MKLKTNQIFYLPRFWQYARARWSEKKRPYFWHFAVICMIYFLILMMMNNKYETVIQSAFYYTGLISTGFVFSLRYFSSLAKPESGLIELMRPASSLEKWLLSVIITMILYPLFYSILFIIMTAPMNWFNLASLPSNKNVIDYQLFIPLKTFLFSDNYSTITTKGQLPVWLLFFFLNSYALATSIFFKRLPIIKSITLAFIIFLIFLVFATVATPDIGHIINYWFDSETYLPHSRAFILGLLWWMVAPLLMFFAGFFALKGRDLT